MCLVVRAPLLHTGLLPDPVEVCTVHIAVTAPKGGPQDQIRIPILRRVVCVMCVCDVCV